MRGLDPPLFAGGAVSVRFLCFELATSHVLDYTLENVLILTEQGFLLDYDFAFPERPGPILSFSLDSQWTSRKLFTQSATEPFARTFNRGRRRAEGASRLSR